MRAFITPNREQMILLTEVDLDNLQDRRSVPARVRVLLWGREERVQRDGRGREPARAAEGGRRLPGVGRREKRKEPRPKQAFLMCI